MTEIEQARKEAMVLTRGMTFYESGLNRDDSFPYFNRVETLNGLKRAGINFEVIGADFAYIDNPKYSGTFPYRFVLDHLIDSDAVPGSITLRRMDGEPIGNISFASPRGLNISDQVNGIKDKILPELLDEESRRFFEVEKKLRENNPESMALEYYNAGILLHLSEDKRTPEEVLGQYLQERGYPVEIVGKKPQWTREYPACLEDPALELAISIEPDVFGTLFEEEVAANARVLDFIGSPNYNYGGGRVSTLCLREDFGGLRRSDDLSEIQASLVPFFLYSDREMIVDTIKARDILRMLAESVRIEGE